ncbi:MAG: cyclic nucleotide-binding domain-containing protein [Pseudomonadota bacterium]
MVEQRAQDILAACEGLPVTEYFAGETIIEEGSVVDLLYLLIEGQVEVVKGDTIVSRVSEPCSVFGEISALLERPTTARVVAASNARFYCLKAAGNTLVRHPVLAIHTAQVLALRLANATELLAQVKQSSGGDGDDKQFGIVDQVMDSLFNQPDRW